MAQDIRGDIAKSAKAIRTLLARSGLIRITLLTLVLVMVANVTGAALLEALLARGSFRYSQVVGGHIATDILVVGNSRGLNLMGGDPTGTPSVYNLAFNGLGRASTIALAKDFFAAGNKAHYVVFEATALFNNETNCETKPFWGLLPALRDSTRELCPVDVSTGRYFPLTLYNGELFLQAVYYSFVVPGGDQDWVNEYTLSETQCRDLSIFGIEDIKASADAMDRVRIQRDIADLEEWLRSKGHRTEILFVLGPLYTTDQTHSLIEDIRSHVSQAVGNRTVVDLSESLGSRCELFADSIHNNRAGRAELKARIVAAVLDREA